MIPAPARSAGSGRIHRSSDPVPAMLLFESIAEEKIREAQARGEFDDLPGAGKPLALDDDPLVPEDLRVAYRILKNAGFVPPEVEAQKEIRALEDLLQRVQGGEEASRVLRKLELLRLKLRESRGARGALRVDGAYHAQILRRLG
jgi:hypothetical protein